MILGRHDAARSNYQIAVEDSSITGAERGLVLVNYASMLTPDEAMPHLEEAISLGCKLAYSALAQKYLKKGDTTAVTLTLKRGVDDGDGISVVALCSEYAARGGLLNRVRMMIVIARAMAMGINLHEAMHHRLATQISWQGDGQIENGSAAFARAYWKFSR